MERDSRESSAETATQLMKAFGIKSGYSMWPDLAEILKNARVESKKSSFLDTSLAVPWDHESYHIHDEEVIDATFDVVEDFWEEIDLEEY